MDSRAVKGECAAANERALYESLKEDGIFLTRFTRVGRKDRSTGQLKPLQLSEFCRQLAVMAGAGISLSRSMGILQEGTVEKRLFNIYGDLQKQMKQGRSISDAMEDMAVFPEMMVNMVRAAEASGQMANTTGRLAVHYQKEHRMENQIRTALFYPALLLQMSLLVMLVVFLVVIPTVEPLFEGMDLPPVTRFLMEASRYIKEFWYLLLPAAVLPLALVPILLTCIPIRLWWDRLRLHLPIVGRLIQVIYTARFARSHASLYNSGLSMVRSLEIAGRTLGNRYLEEQFLYAIRKIQGGEQLSHAIRDVDGLEGKLAPIIYIGEETGRLDKMLESLAENYEHEAEVALTRMVSYIEPLAILLMGFVIGGILLGIMMPLWGMYGNMG